MELTASIVSPNRADITVNPIYTAIIPRARNVTPDLIGGLRGSQAAKGAQGTACCDGGVCEAAPLCDERAGGNARKAHSRKPAEAKAQPE